MMRKLLIASGLLKMGPPRQGSDSHRLSVPTGILGKVLCLLLVFLFSSTGYGQLANQDFESGIPAGWAMVNSTPGTTAWSTSTNGYQGSNGAAFMNPSTDNIGQGNTARYYLITPLTTIPANGQLRFYTKQGDLVNHGTQFEIRLSTAGQTDLSGYTTVLGSYTEANLTTTSGYEEKTINIPTDITPGLQVYIAFVLVNNQTATTPTVDTWLVDNVQLQTPIPCDPVLAANFSTANLTPVSATLNWTHPSATQFEIQVLPVPQTPGPVGTPTDNSYDAINLAPGTQYRVYIKTICPTSSSTWAGPFTFTTPIIGTLCNYPIIIPDNGNPFTFTANLNTFAFAAGPTYPNQGSSCLPSTVTQNYLNGAKAYFTYSPSQNGLISLSNVTTSASSNHITGVFVYDGCTNVGVQCIGGASTSAVGVPGIIPNIPVQAGHTYVIVVSSQLQASAAITFNLTVNTAQCAPPSVFTYNDLLQSSVRFSWDNVGGFASMWEYKVQAAGAGVPVGAGTQTSTNVNNLINTGLTAGTSYDLYVRSVCGGTPGPWSAPYRFTMQCPVFPTPYLQNFNTATPTVPAPCWTPINVNNDQVFWTYQSSAANLTTNTYQNLNNDMFATPQVDLGTTPKRLRYRHQIVNGTVKYAVKISTTGVGTGNFTTFLMPETAFSNNTYQEKIINIPTSITGPVNIAFVVVPGTGSTATRILIDDVTIEDKPACSTPVALTATGITTSTAVLSWTAGDAETQWQIVVQPAGTGIPTGSGVTIDSNTYSPSLNHSTQYEYYVRAYCSETLQSPWAGPIAFTTQCGQFTVPFFENFNTADVGITHKFCWTVNNANADNAQWVLTQPTQAQIAGNPFFGTPSYNDYLISPAIIVEGTKELKFKYKAAFSPLYGAPRFGMEVLMSTTDTNPASFSVIMPFMEFTNIDYIEKALYINADGPVYIAFRVPPAFIVANGGSSILMIDDVRIDEAPACPNPSLPLVSNITTSAATFSWTPGFIETQWEVAVQPAGTGVPTAAGILVSSSSNVTTGSLPVTLTPDTQYEYYVRAHCNDTDQSEWIGPVTFTTLCTAFPTPFIETFEDDSVTEHCWRIRDINNDTFHWFLNMTATAYEGQQAAGAFTGTNGANNDYLISPTISITPNQRLRYQYRVMYPDFEEDLEVRLSTTGVEPASFTTELYNSDSDPVAINNTVWKEKVINLPNITGDINITWFVPPRPASPEGYRGQSLIIDRVIIEDIPACPEPTNLSVQNVADTQAQLKWTSTGTETAWDVYVQPAGMAAPVGDGDPQYFHAASTNPYTMTDLDAATQYDFYVRAACSGTDSAWVGPFHFTTMCSFENLCEYTITLANPVNFGDIQGEISLIQNEVVTQVMTLNAAAGGSSATYTVFLCDGVEFSLFWDAVGSVPSSGEAQATVTIDRADGTNVWTSPAGIGPLNHIIFEGFVSCNPVTCPQPTNLNVNGNGVFTWTAGDEETEWEVFIQPLNNGTLPTTGTTVTATNYTPTASDFDVANMATYEYFVRAVCSSTNKSYWAGPYEFVRNDAANHALALPVNSGEACEDSVTSVSFTGATPSAEPMTCAGTNDGDIWFEFTATSKVHIITADNFSGDYYYANGEEPQPKFTMTLYEVLGTDLVQMACTTNNAIVAAYTTELEIGTTYKVRLTLNGTNPNRLTFNMCVTTPTDPCALNIVNGGFENPASGTNGFSEFTRQQVVLGWRTNVPNWDEFFLIGAINAFGVSPYEGGQFIQMLETDVPQDPADLINVTGTYQDLDSSEITKFDYDFAYSGRSEGRIIQLLAGPPTGPFELIEELTSTMSWSKAEGEYVVPAGQTVTRFLFRSKNNELGLLLDDVNIIANNEIITEPHSLACGIGETTLEAEGTGVWEAAEGNPSEVVIANPANRVTSITGFTQTGDYTFHWKTRYCDYTVVVTNAAVDETPQAETPVNYCIDATAVPLTAPALEDHTLVWYTEPTGGTALTEAPTPVTTTVGTTLYYVAYADADGCEGQRAEIEVIVNPMVTPETGFTYDSATYCTAGANPVITLAPNFTAGGTFSVSPAGLIIDPSTGQVDLAGSEAGTYDITYSIDAQGCSLAGISTVSITVETTIFTVTDFTYEASYCIAGANPIPTLADGFYAGGTFTASAGAAINPVTGEIDLANTVAGTYTITYTVTAIGCLNGGSSSATVTIAPLTAVSVSFSYESPACLNFGSELVPTVANDFAFGGTFTSATLTVNPETGIIDLTNATEGSHEVVYNIVQDITACEAAGTFTATVVLTAGIIPVTEFSYAGSYCNDTANATPQLAAGFTTGGTFTSTEGLLINPLTGEINIAESAVGTYVITYTVPVDETTCNAGGSYSFTTSISGDLKVAIVGNCEGTEFWMTAEPVDNSFDPEMVTYTWRNENGMTVGNDSSEFNVSAYAAGTGLSVPLNFTVTVSSGTCSNEAGYTVTSLMCMIPRGVSPNGDGDNDSFDLTSLGVTEISIFNRYGREVFHYTGNYTNQWHGQDEKNGNLPDGTYFYSLHKSDGTAVTGWVYVSREY